MTLKYLFLFLESGCTEELPLEACLDQGRFPRLPMDVLPNSASFQPHSQIFLQCPQLLPGRELPGLGNNYRAIRALQLAQKGWSVWEDVTPFVHDGLRAFLLCGCSAVLCFSVSALSRADCLPSFRIFWVIGVFVIFCLHQQHQLVLWFLQNDSLKPIWCAFAFLFFKAEKEN